MVKLLALLRGFGFRTFGEVIDESYDDMVFPEQRFTTLMTEVDRLIRTLVTPAARQAFLDACAETCRHNQEHLLSGLRPHLTAEFGRTLGYVLARRDLPLNPPENLTSARVAKDG